MDGRGGEGVKNIVLEMNQTSWCTPTCSVRRADIFSMKINIAKIIIY